MRVLPQKVESVYQLLRATLGVVAVAAGIDKFPYLLVQWDQYLAPPLREALGQGGAWSFMYVVGAIEVVVGVAILSGATRIFGYVMSAWLVGIAINLVFGGYYDIAVRDLVIAASAFCLARLAIARSEPVEAAAPPVVAVERPVVASRP